MPKVAVVAPGRPLDQASADQVLALARACGIDVAFHPQCFLSHHHCAGTDAQRATAFLEVANDPTVDGVWFARGGYGACRILDALPALNEAARTKIYLGYSDAGFLLAALDRAGIGRPVHGPMPADILRPDGAAAIERALAFLTGQGERAEPAVALNATICAALLGTDYFPDLAGRTLLLEEVGEHAYRFDRLLFQITSNADVQRAKGIRLGRVTDTPENDVSFGMAAEQIVEYWCGKNTIAYLGRADIGHDAKNAIVPFADYNSAAASSRWV